MSTHLPQQTSGRVLLLIGAFKLFKATLLVLVGMGALRLLHRDVAEQLSSWITQFRADPHNKYLHAAIARLGVLNEHQLREISFGSFVYAALLTLEGVGLVLRKRWAEYFTVGMTTSLVPLEVLEIYHRVTPLRVSLLVINLAIVAFLIHILLRDRRAEAAREALVRAEAEAMQPVDPAAARPTQRGNQASSHTVR